MPYGALYAASKHAIEGYSESLDHELRNWGIRSIVIEPAATKTPFDANLLEPDAKLNAYDEVRSAVACRVQEAMAGAEGPTWSRRRYCWPRWQASRNCATPPVPWQNGCACCARLPRRAWWTQGLRKDLSLV
jgi:NAD(P)-dependent dehydrogenase (short-subunit alcohol dehydrogenase family)